MLAEELGCGRTIVHPQPSPFAVWEGDQMAMFDSEIEDVAGRFGLGGKAGLLFGEFVHLITGSPGGIGGFVDKFRSAGFGSEAASWLGKTDGPALTAPQVEKALGSAAVSGIASRLDVTGGVVSAAIGYLVPKLIGQLTPGGIIPSGIPAAVSGFLGATAQPAPVQTAVRHVEQVAPRSMAVIPEAPHLGRWEIPLLAGLGVLGLLLYLLSGNQPTPVATVPAPAPVVQAPPPAPIPAVPARLALSNDDGVITYSGTVHDETTRTTVLDSLRAVFGADKVKGDIAVNVDTGSAPWLVNLGSAFESLKTSGVQALFDGNSLKMLRPGFSTTDLLGILNQSIINFPTNSAKVPAISRTLLQQAATAIKQLPSGTVIEISGYTDNTGHPGANMDLSQRRADAVRATLVRSGVHPSMLVAKGYGSAAPVAGNDSLEGRLRNRRIEYRVVKS
jgi:outer membrane protein OmpA-like peptidoglycan-associated protein/uncharacterized protein YidB (DUF937 family)